jgi:hypothetical protein
MPTTSPIPRSTADTRPAETEYAPFSAAYVARVPEAHVLPVLERQIAEVRAVGRAVPAERERFRYAPEKWSVREVLGHVLDSERVFAYRALCVARGEQAPLPAFDEQLYAATAAYDHHPLPELVEEFATVRAGNLAMLRRLEDDAWSRLGTAAGHPISVRALAFMMAGHVRHHLAVLAERYGVAGPGGAS